MQLLTSASGVAHQSSVAIIQVATGTPSVADLRQTIATQDQPSAIVPTDQLVVGDDTTLTGARTMAVSATQGHLASSSSPSSRDLIFLIESSNGD